MAGGGVEAAAGTAVVATCAGVLSFGFGGPTVGVGAPATGFGSGTACAVSIGFGCGTTLLGANGFGPGWLPSLSLWMRLGATLGCDAGRATGAGLSSPGSGVGQAFLTPRLPLKCKTAAHCRYTCKRDAPTT